MKTSCAGVGNAALLCHGTVASSTIPTFLTRKHVPSRTEPTGDSRDALQQLSERGGCGRREIQPRNFN